MAGLTKVKHSFGVAGLDGFHGKSQSGPGEDEFHIRSQAAVIFRHFHRLLHLVCQVLQDVLDFLLFRRRHFRQIVVQFHGSHGFHEKGLACGGAVVDDAAEFIAVFFLHRHHVAAVSLGDNGILQVGRHVLILKDMLEGTADS